MLFELRARHALSAPAVPGFDQQRKSHPAGGFFQERGKWAGGDFPVVYGVTI
jgi:hypothetical protein